MKTRISTIGEYVDESVDGLLVPRWKRWLDIACIALALPLVFPLMTLIGLAIKIVSKGPIFFKQQRIGLLGKPFLCWKFRTMRAGAATSAHQEHLNDLIKSEKPMTKMDLFGDPRLIPFGALLRASGLDELPQLINVAKGEMSLVGPRPCVPYEYEHYQPWQRQRFDTVPGLTGLWQVSGKNKTTFNEMVRLDILYSKNKSLWLDLRIMGKTISALATQVNETVTTNSRRGVEAPMQTASR